MNPNKKVFFTFLSFVLVMLTIACMCVGTESTPPPVTPSAAALPVVTSTWTVPANSICGWIENKSTTGAMVPTMTVWGTGQVLQLAFLEVDAIKKFNYVSPAYFRVYDPVYQSPDQLINFSSIEQVSSCP